MPTTAPTPCLDNEVSRGVNLEGEFFEFKSAKSINSL